MSSFQHRSSEPELLDQPNIPFIDIQQNMRELNSINRWLGGHRITLCGLKALLQQQVKKTPLHIVEIGCGGGDNLRVIQQYCSKHQIPVRLTGIDWQQNCIAFAQSQTKDIQYIIADYATVQFEQQPAIVFSALFCHHFSDQQLVAQLQWMQRNASLGFFINDLHRHWLAYHSIRLLTQFFSNSYLVKNDAPLSVRRAFVREDWEHLLQQAGIAATIDWKWAFRFLLLSK
jgi:trans-aconitate methyltransferase